MMPNPPSSPDGPPMPPAERREDGEPRDFAVIVEVDGTMIINVVAVNAQAACRIVDVMIEDGSALAAAEDLELQRVICTSYAEEG